MLFEMQGVRNGSIMHDSRKISVLSGRAADALRSLIISQQLLGTREILVIHHTDCGKLYRVKEEVFFTCLY